jgi:hypothetical protein
VVEILAGGEIDAESLAVNRLISQISQITQIRATSIMSKPPNQTHPSTTPHESLVLSPCSPKND